MSRFHRNAGWFLGSLIVLGLVSATASLPAQAEVISCRGGTEAARCGDGDERGGKSEAGIGIRAAGEFTGGSGGDLGDREPTGNANDNRDTASDNDNDGGSQNDANF